MKRTRIIAEMAWAHDGSIEKAVAIAKGAKQAGADAIGIHITELDDYMVPYYGSGEGKVSAGRQELDVFKYLKKINPSQKDWKRFASEARKLKISLCVMANDMASLAFASKELKPEYYAVPAACFVEEDFLRALASKKRRTFFRIGGATLGEIERALCIFREAGNPDVVLLHGIQMYPTRIEDTNLALLGTLRQVFGVEVGLAEHMDGGLPVAKALPLLALPYGASWIEKHITFDRAEKGEDFESALGPAEFKEFVGLVRAAEQAIGPGAMAGLSEAQMKYRFVVRKKIVAKADIPRGKAIERRDVIFKRCDVGLTPEQIGLVLGRKAKARIVKDDTVTVEKLG